MDSKKQAFKKVKTEWKDHEISIKNSGFTFY
jgi:hypothetical protein